MALIKKNLMSLFYVIFFVGLLITAYLIYKIYEETYDKYILDQQNYTKVSHTSLEAVFSQYESTLDILGQLLTKNENYKSLDNSREILDDILNLNPTIVAFGLAKPNGQLYVTSSNLKNIKNLPNLAQKKETKDSFNYSLQKDNMVIGRTYYHHTLKTLIIPIRKVIKDNNDKVIAIMTAGINVNKAFDFLGKTIHNTIVFRTFDNYYQLTDNRKSDTFYKIPLTKQFLIYMYKKVESGYKIPIDKIKNQEVLVTTMYHHINKKRSVLTTAKYIKRYELWIITQIDEKILYKDIFKKSLIVMFLFSIISIILYLLFKNLDKYEKNKREALYYQASHDYLTKLHNRYYLSEHFEKIEEHSAFTLLFIDLDNFKNINDNYGHSYGDMILKELALRLESFKNKDDVLIRYSGDEFLLIKYKTDKEKIKKLANKIINRLAEPYNIRQYKFILGASMGISQYPLDANNFEDIKRYADIAMYEAKKTKNTFRVFEDAIKHKYLKSSKMEQELKTAIEYDELYMVYQPQINMDGSLHGVEALVRWENAHLGFVPPNEFIKVAEDTGQMQKIGQFIIEKSLKEISDIQKQIELSFQLSINISVKQFMDENFFEKFMKSVASINFDKLLITLEVTENVFIEDLNYILEILLKFKGKNIKISLDDFGTGYSSLSLLKKLPIDELKIDKSFVDDILVDEVSKNMITSIISIGKKFGMTILAEGIETKEQKELLDSYGCDQYQGYYFSKPLKKKDLLLYLEEHKD